MRHKLVLIATGAIRLGWGQLTLRKLCFVSVISAEMSESYLSHPKEALLHEHG